MDIKPMKILVLEDDIQDCNKLLDAARSREDIEIVAITDSDVDALQHVKVKHPEGIIVDIELNNSKNGNTDSFDFLENLKKLKLNYVPVVIVTTHINTKTTYDILHRIGVDLILYKDHPNYSANSVFNKFISLRKNVQDVKDTSVEAILQDEEERLSECIYHELDLVGITANLKGRQYIHDAVFYLIQNNNNSDISVIQYLSNLHKKSTSTITNGIQNAIIHGWRVSAIEDLMKHYTAKINIQTGIPTPMELIYYYVDKVKKLV